MKKYIFTLGFLGGLIGTITWHTISSGSIPFIYSNEPPDSSELEVSVAKIGGERHITSYNLSSSASRPPISRSEDLAPHRQSHYPDLVEAAELSKESVVFVRNVQKGRLDSFAWFWGSGTADRVSSGSGVIFSKDGYIVTNHHVISEADRIEIVHKKRRYSATLIGSDPSTDIAVVKIEAEGLPSVKIGDSEAVQIGEWVLAVGNPFNLTSTVTAGIISAKGRNINLLQDKFPIESFIQTDAAINPGNSGGALVNSKGELIGINTAILSRTGNYSGYSFAVPVNIVRKVVDDMVRYGEVQRAFTSMELLDIDSELAERVGLSSLNGVLVGKVQEEGAAAAAGLKAGDLILSVNGQRISGKGEIEGLIGHAYPGEKLQLEILRNNKTLKKEITLLNREGNTEIIRRETYYSKKWGIELEPISKVEKDLYKTTHGVKIIHANTDFFKGFPKNFIITHINNNPVRTPKGVEYRLKDVRGRVVFQGITQEGRRIGIQGNIF